MRRLIAFAGAVAGIACANLGSPPGGPQRKEPPKLEQVTPESGAVNVTDKYAVFSFDVVVDDRAGHGGSLASSFVVSPAEGGTVVNWKRDRVEVRPKKGFKPNTAYSVTMLPGVSDLSHNALQTARVIVFSTGATIPAFSVHGRAFDWGSERVAPDARVDVIRLPDSLPYVGVADTTGQFMVGPLDAGTYHVRMLLDNNKNGQRDLNEPWDSTTVVVKTESPFVELRAAIRDSIAPRILTAGATDSFTIAATFDRPLDPATTLTPALFRIVRADSTPVSIARVFTQAQFLRVRATRDSIRAAQRQDSIARADTTRRPDTTARRPILSVDTATPGKLAVPVKPSLPAPARDIIIELDPTTPLLPLTTYRVTAIGVRGLTGTSQESERLVATPRRDTTKAAPKSP